MKLLHTSDWHVGRAVRGRSRHDEHREVFDEIVGIAETEQVDIVLVAGDQFDVAAPTPDAEKLVYSTLMRLANTGAQVVVLAGNHDNPGRLAAVASLAATNRIHIVPQVAPPHRGGVLELPSRDGSETAKVACIPFLSQRGIVTSANLLEDAEHEHNASYQTRAAAIINALTADMGADTINVLTAHLTVVPTGAEAQVGGGERAAHTVFDYHLPPQIFPAHLQYVALGHLHSCHRLAGPTDIRYSGSPLHMDFGEKPGPRHVVLVTARPGLPADAVEVPLSSGRSLLTVAGTLDELKQMEIDPDAWLRVVITEPARTGLADEVRELLPNAVDVRIDRPDDDRPEAESWDVADLSTRPTDLFAEFCNETGIEDPGLADAFAHVVERAVTVEDDTATEGADA